MKIRAAQALASTPAPTGRMLLLGSMAAAALLAFAGPAHAQTAQAPAALAAPAAAPATAQAAPLFATAPVVESGPIRRMPDALAPGGSITEPARQDLARPSITNDAQGTDGTGVGAADAARAAAAKEAAKSGKDESGAPPAEAPKPKPSKAAEAPVKPRAPKVIGGAGSARPGELSPVVKSIPANAWSIPLPASFIEPYRQPVELRLTNLGCYKGETPDGLLGPHGRAAIVRWQKAQGLDGNGIVSDALAQVLIGPTPSNACR